MVVGDYARVPAKAPHFGRAETEMTIQVHGIGPFFTDYHEPVYHLTADGIFLERRAGELEQAVQDRAVGCFEFQVGDEVQAGRSTGIVVEAQCSPSNEFTQYWVLPARGDRS